MENKYRYDPLKNVSMNYENNFFSANMIRNMGFFDKKNPKGWTVKPEICHEYKTDQS